MTGKLGEQPFGTDDAVAAEPFGRMEGFAGRTQQPVRIAVGIARNPAGPGSITKVGTTRCRISRTA
ncbi:hypothetical protein JQ554_31250 [Bradyrhizobium diazoefficiens]|nr:hypothetical protein [Bradyrhizobium diazoefficiens]MBR0968706.1 hypothetical protein [Bradyrhizobium diazoefficiens]MBR0981973.1 hypothetical protein [Bradyrhizobium diazoefficiens]MBR1011480.1 hypothetical protein [Bradyrhizobium diazoefficiens]MBR1017835.1 hypothetical protein [Bradyrhizobium diazoefficiens]MBR1055288.1 hypothetical protein [Bradyrhizobium diazoefficiens]